MYPSNQIDPNGCIVVSEDTDYLPDGQTYKYKVNM